MLAVAGSVVPPVTPIRQDDTHRLIPARWAAQPALSPLADDEDSLANLSELESATNPRLTAETLGLPRISKELVFGIPYASIINGCFTHPAVNGARFNDSTRGAWYASFELATSQLEVAHHRSLELQEVDWQKEEISTYVNYLADFHTDFHDIREREEFAVCLDPNSYTHSQELAARLLNAGSCGVIYPSVRHQGGTCIACFRPQLVVNVRQSDRRTTLVFRTGKLVEITTN